MSITNDLYVIDSREIIKRIEQLSALRAPGPVDLGNDEDNETAQDDLFHELASLEKLAAEASQYAPDWQYGETLIRDDYFRDYAEELAADTAGSPEEAELIRNGGGDRWPFTCMSIDWERAAKALQEDYTAVDFDGVTYWVR